MHPKSSPSVTPVYVVHSAYPAHTAHIARNVGEPCGDGRIG